MTGLARIMLSVQNFRAAIYHKRKVRAKERSRSRTIIEFPVGPSGRDQNQNIRLLQNVGLSTVEARLQSILRPR
ncbi:hypothetical protein N7520_001176 [Penicillium odoratum]|uniref:uncharacterized protein n=1 Tax=Penicillium odoratum TaxID=1167516 RepID=UPI00254958B3|nr:uncharacterized protein N7520_001176 [Penicillium odoratum]KAJ5777930.1 hypothetical protein N7520_001176 [Penicillium odoratum]